ncbi:hypothetical protein ACI3L3_13070 [Desulfobaculum sp. SPO524]|uniref:hypothetical protein n=1 Tax=Desulfobaculum sp. SPO524 TaxID=3378071 RepID=UPI0038530123
MDESVMCCVLCSPLEYTVLLRAKDEVLRVLNDMEEDLGLGLSKADGEDIESVLPCSFEAISWDGVDLHCERRTLERVQRLLLAFMRIYPEFEAYEKRLKHDFYTFLDVLCGVNLMLEESRVLTCQCVDNAVGEDQELCSIANWEGGDCSGMRLQEVGVDKQNMCTVCMTKDEFCFLSNSFLMVVGGFHNVDYEFVLGVKKEYAKKCFDCFYDNYGAIVGGEANVCLPREIFVLLQKAIVAVMYRFHDHDVYHTYLGAFFEEVLDLLCSVSRVLEESYELLSRGCRG